jgi:hypothetical protein
MTEYEDIGNYLISQGITLPIFYDELDDYTPECIAISDYPAFNVYETVSGEEDPDYMNFNIIIRMRDKKTCYTTAKQIYRLLKHLSNVTIGDTFFMEFYAKGPPALIGKTPDGYTLRTINFSSKTA